MRRARSRRAFYPPPPQKLSKRSFRGLTALVLLSFTAAVAAQITDLTCTASMPSESHQVDCTFTNTGLLFTPGSHQRRQGMTGPWQNAVDHIGSGFTRSGNTLTDTSVAANTVYFYRLDGADLSLGMQVLSNFAEVCVGVCESPPVARVAATMIAAAPESMVTLDAGGSSLPADSSAEAPTFSWMCAATVQPDDSQLSPPTITLTGGTTATPTFTAPVLTDTAMPPNTAEAITVTCTVTVTGPGGTDTAEVLVTVRAATGGAENADQEVLPNVLRNTIRGLQTGIFERIRQRQTEDGRWK